MTVFKNTVAWIQNGEPISAGFNGSNTGVINRPLREIFSNTQNLNERVTLLEGTSFLNKSSSFYITSSDNNKKFRIILNNNSILAYLPTGGLNCDGFSVTVIKIGIGTLQVIPRTVDKIYLGIANQAIITTDVFATLTLEYVYSTLTWYPIYKTGTWSFV